MLQRFNERDKLHTFDFSASLVYPTFWIFFISTLTTTVASITDQNFVQRVQCTPSLRQAKLAVAAQMGVAIPINILLFGLGTVIWLFYTQQPDLLNPVMKTDGIYPFFAAQQLPVGASGLVVAALLAATMSTVSSSICSVSDLGVNDFYRRFRPSATDHSSLVVGRVLTVLAGVLGTGAAVLMSRSSMVSVWDLATLVIALISSGIVGMFALGLLTRRGSQAGAITGVIVGMALVIGLRRYASVTFWLFGFIGSLTTFGVGYLTSLCLPRHGRAIEGLTVYADRPTADAT